MKAQSEVLGKGVPKEVDFGVSIFPKGEHTFHLPFVSKVLSLMPPDIYYIPRWWAACTVASNIVFWKEQYVSSLLLSCSQLRYRQLDDQKKYPEILSRE